MNLGEARSFKTAVFAILGALNFGNLVKCSIQKSAKMNKNQICKCVKKPDFALLESMKLISRKICVLFT